jgi:hypothetical protein
MLDRKHLQEITAKVRVIDRRRKELKEELATLDMEEAELKQEFSEQFAFAWVVVCSLSRNVLIDMVPVYVDESGRMRLFGRIVAESGDDGGVLLCGMHRGFNVAIGEIRCIPELAVVAAVTRTKDQAQAICQHPGGIQELTAMTIKERQPAHIEK